MSKEKTSKDTRNATSSPESVVGAEPLNCPVGVQTDLFGPAPVPANPFRWQGLEKALKTTGTSGRSSPDSSVSADLQRCLESRLRQNLDVNGSPEYDLTLKQWDMPSGPPIFRLRAWGRRTSGKDCGGWPTAKVRDAKGGYEGGRIRDGKISTDTLDVTVMLASGQTPSGGPAGTENGAGCRGGWATPQERDGPHNKTGYKNQPCLVNQAEAAGYPTPNHNTTGPGNQGRQGGENIQTKAEVFMMPDMTGWKLNPRFSLWLMGYPAEWGYCAVPAMRLCPS